MGDVARPVARATAEAPQDIAAQKSILVHESLPIYGPSKQELSGAKSTIYVWNQCAAMHHFPPYIPFSLLKNLMVSFGVEVTQRACSFFGLGKKA